MATTITTASHGDCISGSPEKRLDVAPDGTLWAAVIDVGRIRFFFSMDNGTTYSYSGGSDLSLGSGQDTAVPSFTIDADGFAHVCFVQWQRDPQTIIYARGIPRTGGGWSWSTLTLSPAGGRVGVDSDIIAFRNGTGWVAWVAYTYDSGVGGARVAQVNIASNGALSVGTLSHGPSVNINPYQIKSLAFASTGDGRTPAASPHLFFAVAQAVGSSTNAWLYRVKYQSGTWTWETPVVFDTSITVQNTVMCMVHDGTRAFLIWSPTSTTLEACEWDGVAGSVTARNPPALPGGTGNVKAVSMAVDPSTQDIYIVAYGQTNGNVIYCKFTRATTSWGSWTTAVTRSASGDDGQVQLVRYPPRDSIDMVWAEGSGPYTVKGQQLLALTRSPSAPTLISPSNGARADLASGYTFKWDYTSVSPGDTQQGFVFRRQYGGGPTTEYWNVSTQAWQGTVVTNASDPDTPEQVSFPSGKWSTGTTYSWSVRTRSSTGADSAYATNRTVIAAVTPTVVVTAPSGIYYGESTPLVQWTYTSVNAQRDFRVRIVATEGVTIDPNDPLPAVFDSGVITSSIARSLRVTTSLSDGVAYRAYVQATDVNAVSSPWVGVDFTLSLQPPSGPIVEAYDIIQYETNVPRVQLDVIARSNFLGDAQARGQADWEVDANCTLAAQPDDPTNLLVAGLQLTSAAAGNLRARTDPGDPPAAPPGRPQPTGPLSFPVVENNDYTAIASFKAAASVRAARVTIRWYDADDGTGVLISESSGAQVTTGTTGYTQAHVTDVAPSGAVLARMVVEVLATAAAGEVFYASYLSFHPGTSQVYQSGGYAATETVAVERSLDDGVTWSVVTPRAKTDLYQRVIITDREMPFGVDVKYRAVTNVDVGGGSSLTSDYSPISTVSLDSPNRWAIRNLSDDLSEFNALVTDFKQSDDDGAAVFYVANRETPIVDTEGMRKPSGTFTVFAPTSEVDYIISVLRTTDTYVMQSPIGRVYRVRIVNRDYDPGAVGAREITCKFYEVD